MPAKIKLQTLMSIRCCGTVYYTQCRQIQFLNKSDEAEIFLIAACINSKAVQNLNTTTRLLHTVHNRVYTQLSSLETRSRTGMKANTNHCKAFCVQNTRSTVTSLATLSPPLIID